MASCATVLEQNATEAMRLWCRQRYATRCARRREAEVRQRRESTSLVGEFILAYWDLRCHQANIVHSVRDVAGREVAMEQLQAFEMLM